MNKGQRFLVVSLILAGGILGCSRQPAAGTNTANQSVIENPQAKDANDEPSIKKTDPKDAADTPPIGEPKGKEPDRDQHSFTLNPTGKGKTQGNVHLYHVNHINRPAASDDEPFFVVWTDANGYSGAAGIEVTQGGPNKKASDPAERSFHVNLTLRYGGKDKEYRETKCSFHIEVLNQNGKINDGQKGQFQIDGKTYDIAKGTLVLVAGSEGEVQVKLLSRSNLPRDLNEIIAIGKTDADIKAFFPDLLTMPIFSEAAK